MASEEDHVSLNPVEGMSYIKKEIRKVADTKNNISFRDASGLTQSKLRSMGITISQRANSGYWLPANQARKAAVGNALESHLAKYPGYLKDIIDEGRELRERLAECHDPTTRDAYGVSASCLPFVGELIKEGLYYNPAFGDIYGDYPYQPQRNICYMRNYPEIQIRDGFGTPGYPHVTIISIQPQMARSPKDLLCSEIWTLYHWALKLAWRALPTINHDLPIRLVSLCGYQARVVSAVFNISNQLSIVEEMRGADYRFLRCTVHAAEYRDMFDAAGYGSFMEEMAASPCGDSNIQPHSFPEPESD